MDTTRTTATQDVPREGRSILEPAAHRTVQATRRLWSSKLLGTAKGTKTSANHPTADDLLRFFNNKVTSVRQAPEGVTVETSLPPSPAVFNKFELYTAEDIKKIMATATISCALDPLPTQILKEFLSELLPFIVQMCNASLAEGCLPVCQYHRILKKQGPTKLMSRTIDRYLI